MSIERRREMVRQRVTLNGRPAVISGVRNDFANVSSLDGQMTAEWSWSAVARVVANGGAFTT